MATKKRKWKQAGFSEYIKMMEFMDKQHLERVQIVWDGEYWRLFWL